jgi:hypothetical protein
MGSLQVTKGDITVDELKRGGFVIDDDAFFCHRWRALILCEVLLLWNRESMSTGAFFVVSNSFGTGQSNMRKRS